MGVAKLDQNSRPTLTALSNANDGAIVPLWADPVTHRLLVDLLNVSSGSGAPATTPSAIGQMYVDTNGKKIYFATGTTNSGDWTIVN